MKFSTMASQRLLLSILITFFISEAAKSDDSPAFAFSWLNDKDNFTAGDTATIKVRVLGNYDTPKYKIPFKPNITVNDKMGNSCFVSGILLHLEGPTEDWSITFTPIMVGLFNVLITDEQFRVLDSSLHFHVNPGQMYPSAGILSWKDGINEFIASMRAQVSILPKDAFGNNVSSSSEGSKLYNFSLFASTSNGFPASVLNVSQKEWNQQGYLIFDFIAATAGNLLLHVEIENQTLHGSPLPFIVYPGKLDVYSCVARLNIETKYFQLFSMMEGYINQHDQYGNVVSGSYEFDVEVMEKGTNLSMPVADLVLKDFGPGVQSFSFSLHEPGSFMLTISDKEKNTLISNMPYDFTVYIGYCDGINSIVNGSGINNSVAGETAMFSVFLRDAYLYPSPVMLEILQVQIVQESDSHIMRPTIRIRETTNGSFYSGRPNYGVTDVMKIASAPVFYQTNNFTEYLDHRSTDFDVIYKPEKSGDYEIYVFCGNIVLNGGYPFRKEVIPVVVNVSLSGVTKFAQEVPKLAKNQIVVHLVDSYSNPVLLQQSKLKLEIASINKSASSIGMFSDNKDGSYSVEYQANDIGTYEICASYNGERFLPCPFGVNVHDNEYFPQVHNDTVSVWEDESIDFNALENDYCTGGNASIVEYSRPGHGSLILCGKLFRYTPYKGYYGNDTFSYVMSDVNGNRASGAVNLRILCRPPQFVSIPSNLQAMEDVVCPTFGGFAGFEIAYSDLTEDSSVTLSSNSGTVLLSPTQMQFWQRSWDRLSVQKGVGVANELKLPINDPPVINTPSFVIMNDTSDGVLVFGKQGRNFKFIDDPDLLNFPGNRSRFLVMLSMEVSGGLVSTSLPAALISSTQVKLKSSHQWQPLVTFVTIEKHFFVKAKGIRFRGTIDDCNSIIEQLSYHFDEEGEDGAVLMLTVNDLGNHGCYPDCAETMSVSLSAESTVNLVKHEPLSSFAAHTLGSTIILESIIVSFLGLLLLFFVCKCAVLLVHEKKRRKAQAIELAIPSSTTHPPNEL
ncbi:hypothetical protein ACS0TY_015650 [Phlomoides rotata]